MSMELSVWSSYYFDLSPEDALARFKVNGIHAAELSDEHGLALLQRDEDVRRTGAAFGAYAEQLGMLLTQGHLWLGCRLVSNPEAVNILKKWIDLYEAIGIKNMVLHMDGYNMEDRTVAEIHDLNVEKLSEIAAYIAEKDIYICLENLFRPGSKHICELLSVIDRLSSHRFGITLDTGHLNISKSTSQREFILTAGEKLRAIHIADNQGETDQHLMPFGRGTVDFTEVVQALREIGYKGVFNYEIPGENHCPLPIRDAKLRYIREAYRYLVEQ